MKSIVGNKAYVFALQVVNTYKYLAQEQREFVLSKQFLRSGTAIGAMTREAEHAESKADFIHKMSIALKEANETEYWLMLLRESGFLDDKSYQPIFQDCNERIKMLVSIVKTSKKKSEHNEK